VKTKTQRRSRRQPVAAKQVPGACIRWDRLGRWVALFSLLVVLALYIGPAHSYFLTWQDAQTKQVQLRGLRKENLALRARENHFKDPKALEQEARELGMIEPQERPYVVKDIQ
jgi:cell division protein FtsB